MSNDAKLIRMANQIATFFHSQPGEEGPKGVATHINRFWEPRMRRQFFEIVENQHGQGLDPMVLDAVPLIRRPPAPEVGSNASGG